MAYRIDYEALSREPSALDIVVFLVDAMARPGFNLWKTCHACTAWKAKDGLDALPRRPGAHDCTQSCNGCWFALLDDVEPPKPPNPNYTPLMVRKAIVLTDISFRKNLLQLGNPQTAEPSHSKR